ncbi:DNA-binding transcriptional regulator, MocR family, contains an aminotransferase domain [Nonomuraea solani]|uniref:DNA-binding transcriptional regulator, MocR family, contains an aminotransferase domain n=1 Tax=Nonomuraea solani TaxID=1144553 RepID=A0A1H5TLJ0_9ACTN|nr:PLP-dependent aminotransferase family protein [Nonomuraea solani]SEF62897.1 DNA-binding transcriptional regulator, MocR family, contains an aminotransferase domain [Nonomuraea solani]
MLREEADRLGPGARLPSSREIMRRHNVSPVTVSRAIGQLTAEGRVVTRPGSGAFVAPQPHDAQDAADLSWQTVALGDRVVDDGPVSVLLERAADGVVPLTGGYLRPGLRPDKQLAAAAARAVRRPDAWAMPPLTGLLELRRWFATQAGGDVTAADALIVSGGQAALTHAFRALAAPGTPILVETPTYPGALAAARAAGLRATAVPMDRDGVRPELLAEAFAVTGARVFFCQPTLHNPTGATLPVARREQVLEVARAAGAFVVEDDFARYLTEQAPPSLASMDRHGTVVNVGSLTKILSPSMRVAAVIARGPAAHRLRASQLVESFFVARPLQETALEFVGSPAWRRHLAIVHAEIRSRRDALAAALAARLPEAALHLLPIGGMHLWAHLPAAVDENALVEAARRNGVLVSPGRMYYPSEPPGPRLRLTHMAAAHPAELQEGVRRLAQAMEGRSSPVE